MLGLVIAIYCVVVVVWAGVDGLRRYRRLRAIKAEIDRVIAAFSALPPEEQLSYIHPASDVKPPGWTMEMYLARLERREKAH